ncbi:MAG: PilZ domain-containing protein, partial [Treponema sp.]|nr:PilZ domain-containing protein [Treponema sp.]
FLLDDTTKAFYLGVNGIVSEDLTEAMEIDRLQSILSRYVPTEEKRKAKRYKLDKDLHMEFMFTHPENGRVVTGKIKDISRTGLSFQLDNSDLLNDVPLSAEIPNCSLRIGGEIISPICKLVHSGEVISLEFSAFGDLEQEILNDYLERIPLRDRMTESKEENS